MTLYAEDASGTRDSVFIGYDPEATNSAFGNEDERFGEIYIIPDNPNEFRMTAEYWSQPTDSAKKVNIRNNDFNSNLNFEILLDSAIWPVAFTWDVSLLRSDSLPFTSADTSLPNAQIRLGYGGFNAVMYADNDDCYNYSVLITDTVAPSASCFSKNTLILGDFFMNPYRKSNSISIEIMPWNGKSLVNVQEINNDPTIILSPNPVIDELTISLNNALDQPTHFFIYNSFGSLVKTWPCNQALSQTFDLTDLDAGLYIAKLLNKQGKSIHSTPFIKH
jgi:hypothetical protein